MSCARMADFSVFSFVLFLFPVFRMVAIYVYRIKKYLYNLHANYISFSYNFFLSNILLASLMDLIVLTHQIDSSMNLELIYRFLRICSKWELLVACSKLRNVLFDFTLPKVLSDFFLLQCPSSCIWKFLRQLLIYFKLDKWLLKFYCTLSTMKVKL